MRCLALFSLTVFVASFSLAQTPTAYEYHNLSVSSDGTTLYGSSSISGTMSGSFPRGAITHTYTASFTLVPPPGSGIASVPCSVTQSGDPSYNYDPACYASISLLAIGTYSQQLADSARCSYAGVFFSNAGTTVQNPGQYPNLIGIVSLTTNGGTYTASLNQTDYNNFLANSQEYFQSECGCPDYNGVINDIRSAAVAVTVRIALTALAMNNMLTWMNKQSTDASRTPIKGPPNSVKVFDRSKPGSPGKVVRVYGSDGRAVRDIDYGNQAHSGNDPEVHDWTYDASGKPTRAPGRAPGPGDIPPGY